MIKPYDYQIDALKAIAKARRQGQKRTLIVMASGLGKTFTAAFNAQHLKQQNPRARFLILCHQVDILEQLQEEFAKVLGNQWTYGFFHGRRQDAIHQVDFLFGTFQTMRESRTLFRQQEFQHLIVDEGHHGPAPTYLPTIEYFQPESLLALTATPDRADLKDIRAIYGEEVYSLPLEQALARGLLTTVDYRLVIDELADLSVLDTPVGKLSVNDLNLKFFIRKRDEEIVRLILGHLQGVQNPRVMIFCRTTAHCDHLSKLLPGSAAIHHKVPRAEQRLRLKMFRAGTVNIVLTVDQFNEGIDVPEANVIVFLRSTSSLTVFLQQLGRGLRRLLGKQRVLVLDFVANCERLEMIYGLLQRVREEHEKRGEYTKVEPVEVEFGKVHFTETAKKLLDVLAVIRTGYTRERLIQQLRQLAGELGRTPIQEEVLEASKQRKCCSVHVFRDTFGSFNAAIEAAGLPITVKMRYSREELIEQLQSLARELGRTPTSKETKRSSLCASNSVFRRAFGTFNKALKAAGLEVNQEGTCSREELLVQLQALAKQLGRSPNRREVGRSPLCAKTREVGNTKESRGRVLVSNN